MKVSGFFDCHSWHQGVRLLMTTALALTLASCELATPVQESALEAASPVAIPAADDPGVAQAMDDDAERHRRYIANILYDGMRALRVDRLMTPPEDSAYHYFSRVLAFEPDNTIALDGMRDIALRYLQLADAASRQGQFDNAETFQRRAASVDDQLPAIAVARQTLATARAQTHSVHTLSNRELAERQPSISRQLEKIARVVAENNTFVLITAPSDELGRWIYAQLQSAMTDSRLRADIEIGEQASIRLVLPRAG